MNDNVVIGISSQSLEGLNALVDPRFGRCRAFTVVSVQNGRIINVKGIENPSMASGGGAGIQAAQLIRDAGVKVVLTGNLGPNASDALNALGIKVFLGISGTVENAVTNYLKGQLQPSNSANVPLHTGAGRSAGMGRGPRVD